MATQTRVSRYKKRRLKRWVYKAGFLFSIILLVIATNGIFNWWTDNKKIEKLTSEINNSVSIEEKIPDPDLTENINPPEPEDTSEEANDYWDYMQMNLLSVDFTELLNKNKDTVGWIKVNGTNINYPIVQTTDNSYYLTHAFDGSYNDAGWIYADYRNDMVNFDKNTVIYGHSRLDTTMFGSLKNILESDWYNNKDNHIIKLSTPTENTLWQVFSVYTIEAESYYITTEFYSDEQYKTFLDTLKNRSNVSFSATVNTNDKILTLSTCKDNFGNRVVMHAKLIKKETRN